MEKVDDHSQTRLECQSSDIDPATDCHIPNPGSSRIPQTAVEWADCILYSVTKIKQRT
jgi:hypothetical protein